MKPFLLFILVSLSIVVSAQSSKNVLLSDFLSAPSLKNATVSLCVVDAKTGEVLLSNQSQLCVIPASVQKLITSATALEMLGGDCRFCTTVWYDGKISAHKLSGNLIITGGGDPTLGSENFGDKNDKKRFLSEWAHRVKQAGIDTIDGNIVADPSLFSDQDVPSSWLWEDVGNHYGAAASGISVYDNIFKIYFDTPATVGVPTTIRKIDPDVPGLEVQNNVLSSEKKGDNAYVFGSPFNALRVVKGTLPAGSNNFSVKASVPNPALLLATEFKKVLSDSSVLVLGQTETRKAPKPLPIDSSRIIEVWLSPSLAEIVERMNKESINLYAETLLKQIGLAGAGEGSINAGIKVMNDFWKDKGIDTGALFLADGSGLSRLNAFSSKLLADVLVFMNSYSKWSETYKKSIPLAGIEGTQKYYFQESVLKGKARAKTGSMTRVRSMAGYMPTRTGREVAFAIILNNYNGDSSMAKSNIEKVLEVIYDGL